VSVGEITFVGTGEAFDPELPNTSLLYRGSRNVLFDCGYSVPHAFWRLSKDPSLLDAVYVSHLHADHSFGLPALLLWMRKAGRRRPLVVLGGPGVEPWLKKLLNLGYPRSFAAGRCYAIEPRSVVPGRGFALGRLAFTNAKSAHSVQNVSVRVDDGGRVFCYSGDGAPSAATGALYRGADVLVHECYSASDPEGGHATLADVLELAERSGVSRLCLLHIARAQKTKVAALVRRARRGFRIAIPAPGDVVEV
jgi:ribonuclease Z